MRRQAFEAACFYSRQSRTSAWDTLRRPAPALPRQDEEPVSAVEGQPAEECGVDEREPSHVDADTEGQSDDGRRREPTFFEEKAQREAQVLEHGG